MTQISMDKDLAEDLINSKLRSIKSQISEISCKWAQKSAEKMNRLSRQGKLPESEMDEISLTNLLQKLKELEHYQQKLVD